MQNKVNRWSFLPYLWAVLLVAYSTVIDGSRNRLLAPLMAEARLWEVRVVQVATSLVFATFCVILIWALARNGISSAGASLFILGGLLLSAIPILFYATIQRLDPQWMFLLKFRAYLGDHLILSAAVILVAGIVVLVTRSARENGSQPGE